MCTTTFHYRADGKALLALIIFTFLSVTTSLGITSSRSSVRQFQNNSFNCELVTVHTMYSNISDSVNSGAAQMSSIACIGDGDISYDIELPSGAAKQFAATDGKATATIYKALIDEANYKIQIEKAEDIVLTYYPQSSSRRRVTKTVGNNSVLVLRVSYVNQSPTVSLTKLSGVVFGRGMSAPKVSLVDQLRACSAGKLKLIPAAGSNFHFGTLDIKVSTLATGNNSAVVLENLAIIAASKKLGVTLSEKYDHVMMVLPDGFLYGGKTWIGYGYTNSWRTVFNNEWAGYLSLLGHEIGHNLNLAHSGFSENVYGDVTGYMGYSVPETGYPRRCFNAQNHWYLGWYSDRSISLTVGDLPWTGYLTAFPHYNLTGSQQQVLISFEKTTPRLFAQYNRATLMNAETGQNSDQVVIIQDYGGLNKPVYQQSWLVAGIAKGITGVASSQRISNYSGTSRDLIIEVCITIRGPPDMVQLNIYLYKGSNSPLCSTRGAVGTCIDDDLTLFFVDEKRGYRTCRWFRSFTEIWFEFVCDPLKSSYHLCKKSCGSCHM